MSKNDLMAEKEKKKQNFVINSPNERGLYVTYYKKPVIQFLLMMTGKLCKFNNQSKQLLCSPLLFPVDYLQLSIWPFWMILTAVNLPDSLVKLFYFHHKNAKCSPKSPVHPGQSHVYCGTMWQKPERTSQKLNMSS